MPQIINHKQAAEWNGEIGRHWAEHAERYDAISSGFDLPLFDAAAIEPRARVLDIGCGNGQTTLLAARYASRGEADGIDLSEPMLARARQLAAGERFSNVAFIQGDAQIYPFVAGHYDVAISRGGVMFFADHVAAFGNVARALRPGGRLAFISPRPAGPDADAARVFAALGALARVQAANGSGHADSMERAMMSLADPDRIRAVLAAANFANVSVEAIEGPVTWGRDADEAVDFALAMSRNRHLLDGLDVTTRASVSEEIRADLQPFASAWGVRTSGSVWLVSATRA